AQIQHRTEGLHPGGHFRALARKKLYRVADVARALVFERASLHLPALASASTMRRGVMGDSVISTPSAASASFTAFAIAAGGAMAPPSPMPFCPKRVYGDGVSRWSIRIEGTSVALGNR